jgi:hypothetical protein
MRRSFRLALFTAAVVASACVSPEEGQPARVEPSIAALQAPVPSGGPPFVPETYRESGLVVMPITFPDGSRAELAYPPQLNLHGLNVTPDGYLQLGQSGCGRSFIAARSDLRGEIWRGKPAATYPGSGGGLVGLWSPAKGAEPYHWLAYRFGEWNLFVPCDDSAEQNDERRIQSRWARSLAGKELPSGFLVLDPQPPLRFGRGEQTIRLSSRHLVIDIELGRFKPFFDRHVGTDGLAEWVTGGGRIHIYALSFSERKKEFIRDVAASLRVRNVRVE